MPFYNLFTLLKEDGRLLVCVKDYVPQAAMEMPIILGNGSVSFEMYFAFNPSCPHVYTRSYSAFLQRSPFGPYNNERRYTLAPLSDIVLWISRGHQNAQSTSNCEYIHQELSISRLSVDVFHLLKGLCISIVFSYDMFAHGKVQSSRYNH